MVWIQNENGVDNTLMFWGLLSHAYPESKMSFFLSYALTFKTYTKETGMEHSWDKWPEFTKRIFHTTECHGHYIN